MKLLPRSKVLSGFGRSADGRANREWVRQLYSVMLVATQYGTPLRELVPLLENPYWFVDEVSLPPMPVTPPRPSEDNNSD